MMLPANELAAIRADVLQMLPDTGHILSVTLTPDGTGYSVETWGTATAAVAYRLDPLRGAEKVTGGAVAAFHSFVLTLPYNATITAANRFKDKAGNTYSVTSVDTVKSWAVSVRAVVEKI